MHLASSRLPSGRGAADGRNVRLTRSILDGLTLRPSVLRLTGSARTFVWASQRVYSVRCGSARRRTDADLAEVER
jgi:hypothetical protein